jgi:hypothetical protein
LTSASTWSSARPVRSALAAAALALSLLAPREARGIDEEGCLECHGLPGFAVREAGGVRNLGLAAEAFSLSAHGDLGCRECHSDIASIPHGERREVNCGQPCHGKTLGGKAYSHEGLYWEFTASSHGGAGGRKVGCLLCHPTPERREGAQRDKLGEARRCGSCHRGNAKVRAWFLDRHFAELAAGNQRAPSCPDCHGTHRVHPATAAESTVSPARLADTCSSGALGGEQRGGKRRDACHGTIGPSAVERASMNMLPQGGRRRGRIPAFFTLAAGCLLGGLVVRAGVGLLRGR